MAHISETTMLYPLRGGTIGGVVLQAMADVGASGAVTLAANSNPGLSITRTGTGAYTITFPIGETTRPPIVEVVATNIVVVQKLAYSATNGTLTIACFSDAGSTAADPASGSEIMIVLVAGTG